jgi:peptidyl-prolyl cis-trans isomerase A (cyclophilin A)
MFWCIAVIQKSMQRFRKIILFFLPQVFVFTTHAQQKINCLIKTSLGNISIELYADKAPITVANFLRYVDARLFDSSSFFRAVRLDNQPNNKVKIEVIQGGLTDSTKDLQPIPIETTQQTGILHKDGTISMARGAPNSATGSFFICINDQSSLDYGGERNPDGQGFAAFGKVTKGMDLVRKIQQLYPGQGQYFQPQVTILTIRRLNRGYKRSGKNR